MTLAGTLNKYHNRTVDEISVTWVGISKKKKVFFLQQLKIPDWRQREYFQRYKYNEVVYQRMI